MKRTRQSLQKQFDELSGWLHRTSAMWRERPFVSLPVSWETEVPALAASLRALPEDVVTRYASSPETLPGMPEPFGTWVEQADELTRWPTLACPAEQPNAPRPRGVPERKWEQITHLVPCVQNQAPRHLTEWVDWCSGKGHLGNLIARRSGKPVRCVDHDGRLCRSGEVLSEDGERDIRFRKFDVLQSDSSPYLHADAGLVALHACGELHANLIRQAVGSENRFLAVVPCCYHRFGPENHEPLSDYALNHPQRLGLTREHLRLVGFEEPVSRDRRKTLRRREHAWRLGANLLLESVSGQAGLHHMGALPRAWIDDDFEKLCRRLAERADIALPASFDASRWETLGYERSRIVHALGLVRGLFRRPLESWLVLDRCLCLDEAGYAVSVGTFCEPGITPRNLLITALR